MTNLMPFHQSPAFLGATCHPARQDAACSKGQRHGGDNWVGGVEEEVSYLTETWDQEGADLEWLALGGYPANGIQLMTGMGNADIAVVK